MNPSNRLYRATSEKMISGVAAGMAARFGIDTAVARIIWCVLLFAGPGLPLYLICWFVIPREQQGSFDEIHSDTGRSRSTFSSLFKIFLLLVVGAIFASHVDSDIAVVAFLIGLCCGLYYLWRNRSQDDDAETPGSSVRSLYRSESNKRVLGVFGGLGEAFGIDATILRVLGAIVLIAGFPIIIPAYLVYAVVVPVRRVITL